MGNNYSDPNKPKTVMPAVGVRVDIAQAAKLWHEALCANCGPHRDAFQAARASITQAAERIGRTKTGAPAAAALLADLATMERAFSAVWAHAFVFPAHSRQSHNKANGETGPIAKKKRGPYARLRKEWDQIQDAGGWSRTRWKGSAEWANERAKGIPAVNAGTLRTYAGSTWPRERAEKLRSQGPKANP